MQIGVLAAIAVILSMVAILRPPPSQRTAEALIDRHLTTNDGLDVVREVLGPITTGTRFADRWAINSSPRRNMLNVYLVHGSKVDARLLRGLLPISGNCQFLGAPNVVVIDVDYLRQFLERRKFHEGTDAFRWRMLVYWVVAHEVGHIVHGDNNALFDKPLDEHVHVPTSREGIRELRADEFVIQQTPASQPLADDLDNFLVQIINAKIEAKVGFSDIPDVGFHYNGKPVIQYAEQPTHPEFIVRAVRLLEIRGRQYPKTGLTKMVEALVRHMSMYSTDGKPTSN